MAEPSSFPEQTRTLGAPPGRDAQSRGECLPLGVYSDGSQCVSLWRLTWRERLSALVFGRAWVSVFSGPSQPPIWIAVKRTVFSGGRGETQ